MTDETWGPWIEHDGNGMPFEVVGRVILVLAEYHTGGYCEEVGCPRQTDHPVYGAWDHRNFGKRIPGTNEAYARVIRYRVQKPRALLDLIERARSLDDAPQGPVRIAPRVPA